MAEQNKPTKNEQLESKNEDASIGSIGDRFEREINQYFAINSKKLHVSNEFVRICNEHEFDDIETLKSDFDEKVGIDGSVIFEELMKFPALQPYKQSKSQQIFDLLIMVIYEKGYSYLGYMSFDLDNFATSPSDYNLKRANEKCKAIIPDLFKNDSCCKKTDNSLMKAKALDFENRFPLLLSIMGLFNRYVLKENEQYWKQKMPNSKRNTFDPQFEKPFASTWFKESGYYKQKALTMSKKEIDCLGCFGSAIESLQKRAAKFINLNHKRESIIYDSLDAYVQYLCVMNEFVFNEYAVPNYVSSSRELPVQIDFCVIPRLAKTNVYNNYVDDSDDDESDEEDDEKQESIQNFGKQMGEIWDLEQTLNESGYVKSKDYWTRSVNCNDISRTQLRELWKIAVTGRYKRYICLIDRRNPQHIKNKKMEDDTDKEQTWQDKLYLIRPKEANEIAKEYDDVLNEVFIENTKKYLLPLPGMKEQNLEGLDDGNGYKFMVSYHLYNKNRMKMYWYYGAGMTRFHLKDIEWLWPRYFKADKNGCFQTLSVESKSLLKRTINEHTLRDPQFNDFEQQFAK